MVCLKVYKFNLLKESQTQMENLGHQMIGSTEG